MENNQTPTPSVIPTSRDPESTVDSKTPRKFPLKIIIGIIIFLLLAGGAAASFTVFKPQLMSLIPKPKPTVIPNSFRDPSPTPTADSTADWRTYQGDGFSIKYPSNQLRNSSDICPDHVDRGLELYVIDEKIMKEQPLLFCGSDVPLSFRIYQIEKFETPESDDYREVIKNEKTMDGITGQMYISVRNSKPSGGIESPFKKTVLINLDSQGKKLMVYYGFPSTISEETFNQILSTFKFTDAQSLNISGWKTIKTSFLQMEIPSYWYLWNCDENEEYSIILKDDQQPSEYGKSCPFGDGGTGLLSIKIDKNPFKSLRDTVPKSSVTKGCDPKTNDGPESCARIISDIKYFKIGDKQAVEWKEVIQGGYANGERQVVNINPNITLTLLDIDRLNEFRKILSTLTLTD